MFRKRHIAEIVEEKGCKPTSDDYACHVFEAILCHFELIEASLSDESLNEVGHYSTDFAEKCKAKYLKSGYNVKTMLASPSNKVRAF